MRWIWCYLKMNYFLFVAKIALRFKMNDTALKYGVKSAACMNQWFDLLGDEVKKRTARRSARG